MNTGGPAFPVMDTDGNVLSDDKQNFSCTSEGMTLRDYFAAKIIPAIIPPPKTCEDFDAINESVDYVAVFAKTAYLIADAMIKERESKSVETEDKKWD